MDCSKEFFGHSVCPKGLLLDFELAFVTLLLILPILIFFIFLVKRSWRLEGIWQWVVAIPVLGALFTGRYYLFYFPNATYLFFELRHLINTNDNVADHLELEAVAVFVALSLLGLILTVVTILATLYGLGLKGYFKWFSMLVLVFLAVFGGVLGMNELNSIEGLTNFNKVLKATIEIARDPSEWLFIIPMTASILLLTAICDWIIIKPLAKKLWN